MAETGAGADGRLDAARLAGALADATRRRVVAAVELGAATPDAVAAMTGLDVGEVSRALGRLVAVGVVGSGPTGLSIDGEAIAAAARAALSRRRSDEHDGEPEAVRKVLDAFVVDGRITKIPAAQGKRLVLLDWLAQDFEPGTRYSEPMVNLILGRRHADTAALRRYLVDHDFLDRDRGEYWRSGGTVPA
jgi:hypothetical protein